MKSLGKKIGIVIIISILCAGASTYYLYSKINKLSQDNLLMYISAKQAEKEGEDGEALNYRYQTFIDGYADGNDVVGGEAGVVIANTLKLAAITIFIISLIAVGFLVFRNDPVTIIISSIIIFGIMPLYSWYELDYKYKEEYKQMELYKDSIKQPVETHTSEQNSKPIVKNNKLPELESIQQFGISEKVQSESNCILFLNIEIPQMYRLGNYKDYEKVAYINSIKSVDNDNLDYKIDDVSTDSVSEKWIVKLGVKLKSLDTKSIIVDLKSPLDDSFSKKLIVDVPQKITDKNGSVLCFDYDLDEKNKSFNEKDLYDIKVKNIPNFKVESLSVKNKEGNTDLKNTAFPDLEGRPYVNITIHSNLENVDEATSITDLHYYANDISKYMLNYGYAVWDVIIYDKNNQEIYNSNTHF
ncbi:hypothetical protein C671_1718 [[Clostridium] bifermentans ATCC 19299]|uniref:hypothetical protein n=1 Tax=Paraclostridium bifermentans TaxID=1490 RepID=UPI00038CEC3E|nr:hypothetical protein [Paraclostridium bifermentans]EQK45867.1 hypothetical protein C671_1718 [[Clostridium] bifermentans ATCC 19299] [Paraclostridium bifermentans ATCC 19299]